MIENYLFYSGIFWLVGTRGFLLQSFAFNIFETPTNAIQKIELMMIFILLFVLLEPAIIIAGLMGKININSEYL